MTRRSRGLLVVVVVVALVHGILSRSGDKSWKTPSIAMSPTIKQGATIESESVSSKSLRIGMIVVTHVPTGANIGTSNPFVCGNAGQGYGKSAPCDAMSGGRSKVVLVKRIVALGGDRISFSNGHVILNGIQASEPYATSCISADVGAGTCTFPTTITVPAGTVYVVGDNRADSDDSRFWGPLPDSYIVGKVTSCGTKTSYCN